MKKAKISAAVISACAAIVCMAGMSVSASAGTSISDCEVLVDTYSRTVTVELDGETVPESEYHIIFFSYAPTEGGESLERVGTDFPNGEGQYIAAVVANDGSEYTGENRSEPFTVEGEEADLSDSIVYVTVDSKNVTVRLGGGLVSNENYHVTFFAYEETETGERLERIGDEFPTEPGTYIAAVDAADDSIFFGSKRSDPFTVEAALENNPGTGVRLPGLSLLVSGAAAAAFTAKRKQRGGRIG